MGAPRHEIEAENRIERENRDMDDMVAISSSSVSSTIYHEIDQDGTPVCMVSESNKKGFRTKRRGMVISWNFHPCKQDGCWKTIDGD